MGGQLQKSTEETLSNLYESKYFDALSDLIAEELEGVKTFLLNKSLTDDEFRFYQGRAEGLGVVLIRIEKIHQEFAKPK